MSEHSQAGSKLESKLEWHTEVWVKGPVPEIDAHQKIVEELADLAELDLTVAKAYLPDDRVTARFSVHFDAERAIDALFMAMGLCAPKAPSDLEITEVGVTRQHKGLG